MKNIYYDINHIITTKINRQWKNYGQKLNQLYKIPSSSYTLTGYSWASDRTSFYIPELNIMLDCGVPNNFIPEHIFITHGHSDHSLNLPSNLLSMANSKNTIQHKPTIYTPDEIKQYVRDYIHTFYVMSKYNPNHQMHTRYELVGVNKNASFQINIKNKKINVDVIECCHKVPCVGYGFTELRSKLKNEYHGKKSDELKTLKTQNVQIMYDMKIPLFCYLGDSNIDVFKDDQIMKYPVILTECTFLMDDDVQHAIDKYHIHWSQLDPIIQKNPEKTFILYHFSHRYTVEQIKNFFDKIQYKNIIVWV